MKIKISSVLKTIIITILYILIFNVEINEYTNTVNAILTLIVSGILVYKTRLNPLLVIVSIFIFYSNYSIVIGEYIVGGDLSVYYTEVKNTYYYGMAIKMLLMFMSTVTIFYNGKKLDSKEYKLKTKDNIIIYFAIMIMLLYILVFEVDRGNMNHYSVRISTLYAYSPILLLFLYYFSGGNKTRINIFVLISALFIVQDIYYGGRITSLQIVILIAITLFIDKIQFGKMIKLTCIGIVANSLIAAYRRSYTLYGINIFEIISNLIEGYFVFDTPVGAYYASATHIAAAESIGWDIRIESFLSFLKSIALGSKDIISNVTIFVSDNYYLNGGGGVLPSHFYFWLGWSGVILISIIVVLLFNKIGECRSDISKLIILSIISRSPSWYLYTPTNFFRSAMFMTMIMYFVFIVLNRLSLNIGRKNIEIKKYKYGDI